MQPPPVPETLKISYQMPRNVLIRIWWKRMMLRPRVIAGMTIMLAGAIFFFVIRAGIQSAGFVILALLIMTPINFFRVLAKAIDGNSQFTDPKSLFGNYEGRCGEGFWLWPRRRVPSIPAAGCKERANAGHGQKTRRPEGFRGKGRLASLLLSRRSTKDILLRRA